MLYGTAWKEERTRALVSLALETGFRGFDTANQRKHYDEAAVGSALGAALRSGAVLRDELFLQTKFTHRDGQDERLPYDPRAAVGRQVEQSFASSLEHLGVETLDSYVLHGPSLRNRLAPEDLEAWSAMEDLHRAGRTGALGASNVTLRQLENLCERAAVLPAHVQNRCYASSGWDRDVRAFCARHRIVYQAFSLLTANRAELASPLVATIAARTRLSPAQVIFRFALQVGMLPLTGTSRAEHMRADLAVVDDIVLEDDEVASIETIDG
jgi:diketogulonate reductase-like aldo/keto reductase